MDTSLGELRQVALGLRAWSSTGATFNTRFRRAANLAKDRMVGEVPEAVVSDIEHAVLLARVDSAAATVAARLRTTADPWVLEFRTAAGGLLTSWFPVTDGTWDGIMHLDIQDPASRWHRRQSREWWTSNGTWYVSLDRPWQNLTDTAMPFHIYQPEVFTRADAASIKSTVRVWDEVGHQPFPITRGSAHRAGLIGWQQEAQGRPCAIWPTRRFQMPTPTLTPTTTSSAQRVWAGPVQEGTFTFRQTYVWGRRDLEWQQADYSQTFDPMWESAPSPASAVFDHNTLAGRAITLQGTNIDAMRNFDVIGTLREGRSGYRIRWYVARTAVRTGGLGAADYNQVDVDGRYYLLAEVEPTSQAFGGAVIPTYEWTGAVIPDFSRPLVFSQGYQAWSVYPHQDARYELDFDISRRPSELVDDSDVLPIDAVYFHVYIELLLYYLCLADGVDRVGAIAHLAEYRQTLGTMRAGQGGPARVVLPASLDEHNMFRQTTDFVDEP